MKPLGIGGRLCKDKYNDRKFRFKPLVLLLLPSFPTRDGEEGVDREASENINKEHKILKIVGSSKIGSGSTSSSAAITLITE